MKKITISMMIFFAFVLLISCKSTDRISSAKAEFTPQFVPGPPALVYKTKKDYNNLVPVILSDDKSKIVSFPHPRDIKTGEEFQTPTLLENGYLLDNRGISPNVAFLNLTYEEYSQLKEVPSAKELFEHIVDNNPLTEMCDCGLRTAFDNEKEQINKIITNKELYKICKTIYKK